MSHEHVYDSHLCRCHASVRHVNMYIYNTHHKEEQVYNDGDVSGVRFSGGDVVEVHPAIQQIDPEIFSKCLV